MKNDRVNSVVKAIDAYTDNMDELGLGARFSWLWPCCS